MIPDYHLHTQLCGHAVGSLEEYLSRAREKNIPEIGFSDHCPMFWLPPGRRDPGLAMAEEDLPAYVAEVDRLKSCSRSPLIRLGLEVDYIAGWEENISRMLAAFPFDYVIGSVHYIDGWGFDNPDLVAGYEHHNLEEIYEEYFDLVCRSALSGLFDVVAHPDLVKKFGHQPAKEPVHLYEKAALDLARAGVCLEVNTAGLRYPAGEIYPALNFLKICREYGVPVSTGSDAHSPDQVGGGFAEAELILKEAGYTEVSVFRERKRYPHSL